jgi:hypothetical protein
MAAILSPHGLYGGNRKSKIPLINRDTSPQRALWEFVFIEPSDGCPATAPRVASMQALRSRRMSSASKLPAPYDPKPVRPVLARQPRPVFGLGFVAQPSNPMIFW